MRAGQKEMPEFRWEVIVMATEAAALRDRYAALNSGAPVGSPALDSRGVIPEANRTATVMLGVRRSRINIMDDDLLEM